MELDAWGRHLGCVVCSTPLKQRGKVGRPGKTCKSARCVRIYAAGRKRRVCARCRCPLLFEAERLAAVCNPCATDLLHTTITEQIGKAASP